METIDLLNQRYGRGCAGAGVGEESDFTSAHVQLEGAAESQRGTIEQLSLHNSDGLTYPIDR